MTSYRIEVLEPSSLLPSGESAAEAFERVWELIPKDRPRRLWAFLEHDHGLFVKGLESVRRRGLHAFSEGLRLRRERKSLTQMAARGLPVPRVVAYGQESRSGLPARSFLVERLLKNVKNLDDWLQAHEPGDAARPWLFDRLGELLHQMHSVNVFHGDLSCRNILIEEQQQLHLIDCPRARIDPLGVRRSTVRRSDLFRLVRGLIRAGASEAEIMRLFEHGNVRESERRVVALARKHLAQSSRRREFALNVWLMSGR